MMNEVMADADSRMKKTIESFENDLTSIRTGRASPALVDRLMVDYYGVPTPLQQIASISVPEAQQLAIRPYTATDIPAIERAIATSDLGLNPNSDGQQVRLTIPALTEERRRDMTKQIAKKAEDARVSVRNIRRDCINDLREMEKESMISEDDLHQGQDQVQDKTNDTIKQVDAIAKDKEQEVMTL